MGLGLCSDADISRFLCGEMMDPMFLARHSFQGFLTEA